MQSPMVPLNVPQGDGRGAGAVVISMPEPPRDHTVWSIATFIYGNLCCLGLVALIFSMKSRDRRMLGDMTGAQSYGSKARRFNIIALVLIALSTVLSIVIVVVISVTTASVTSSYPSNSYGGRYSRY